MELKRPLTPYPERQGLFIIEIISFIFDFYGKCLGFYSRELSFNVLVGLIEDS